MTTITFEKSQLIGITELQRNASAVSNRAKEKDIVILKNNTPHVVVIDFDRYEQLLEKAEQAEIYAMLQERNKKDIKWMTTKEAFAGLSLFNSGGKTEYEEGIRKPFGTE